MKKELMFQRVVSLSADYEYLGHYYIDENETPWNQPDVTETMDKVIELLKSINVDKFTVYILSGNKE